jgi:DNA-binding beta-propeller fold protein YncE
MTPRAAFVLSFLVLSRFAVAEPPLVAGKPIPLAGTKGAFDFVEIDAAKHRLLAAHTGNGSLDVIDLASGALLKAVPTGAAQGVTVDEADGKYCVSVSKEQKAVIVDRESLEVTGEVPLSGPADALTFSPKNGCAYLGHDDGKELWVVNVKEKKLTATIAIPNGEGPEYVVYDLATDRLFQNLKFNDTLAVIDATANKVIATWETKPAAHPHGLAFEAKTDRLFVAGTNGQLAVLDAKTGKVTGSVKIATGIDQIAFDAVLRRVYCGSKDGVISIVQVTDTGVTSLGDAKSAKGAKTLAVDPATHAVWTVFTDAGGPQVLKLEVPAEK